jgi:hypothetical protein
MTVKEVEMSERDRRVMEHGDNGQGEYLVGAKYKNSKPPGRK